MLKLTKREIFKFNKNLKIDQLINDIADGFNKSFQDGIAKTSTDINGKKFKVTNNPTPLLDKGKMKNTYVKKRATRSKKSAEISMNIRDRKIPSIAHNQGLKPQIKREWFGVGKVQTKIGSKLARLHIKKALK